MAWQMDWVMALDELTMNERLDQHDRRLDAVENRQDKMDGRLIIHSERVERHERILVGDTEAGITGLVSQLKEISQQLDELKEWRLEITTHGRVLTHATLLILRLFQIVIGIVAAIGINVWWPALVEFYQWLVGGMN